MDYGSFFSERLDVLRRDGSYRTFNVVERRCGDFPRARWFGSDGLEREITVWCSNDYLGLGQDAGVLAAQHAALDNCGAGAGGTRNISGSHKYLVDLEVALAASSWQVFGVSIYFWLCCELDGLGDIGSGVT